VPFPELAPAVAKPDTRHYTRKEIERNRAARRETYAAIRLDAEAGLSERAIERKHHVGRRTIIKALASAEPPARKKIHREPAALNGLHGHIDAMIDAAPRSAPPRSGSASPTTTASRSPTRPFVPTSPSSALPGMRQARPTLRHATIRQDHALSDGIITLCH
jgi:hypothetical protein